MTLDETGLVMRCHLDMRFALAVIMFAACDAPLPVATTPPPTPPAAPLPPDAAIAAAGSAEVMATIARTPCYGWCPVYQLKVWRDGRIEYHGDEFVKLRGSADGQITKGQVDELDRAFAKAHYFDLADKYTEYDATDAPSVNTSYRLGNRTKTIEHYHGDDHAPDDLATLENAIDTIVGVDRWIGTKDEREAHAREWR